ncbi:MAG: hypothetical protein KGL39_11065 [Patescibacteria group bacterium]|nr:hypothetical protein [Patescibacteria group bacterium]
MRIRKLRKYGVYFNDGGDGGTGDGGTGGGNNGTGTKKSEPETFSREYVTELRNESASYRNTAKDERTKREAAESAAEQAKKDAETKAAEAEKRANDRIIIAEMRTAALKAGMVDLDGLKLADLSKVKLNEKGEIEGGDALMEEMKKAKPYLFQTSTNTSSTKEKPKGDDQGGKKKATEMTDAEWAAEKKKFKL